MPAFGNCSPIPGLAPAQLGCLVARAWALQFRLYRWPPNAVEGLGKGCSASLLPQVNKAPTWSLDSLRRCGFLVPHCCPAAVLVPLMITSGNHRMPEPVRGQGSARGLGGVGVGAPAGQGGR